MSDASDKAYSIEQRLNAIAAAMPARVYRTSQQGNFASTSEAGIVWQQPATAPWFSSAGIPVFNGNILHVRGLIVVVMGTPNNNQFARLTGPSASFVAVRYTCEQGTGSTQTIFTGGICTAMEQDMTINTNAGTANGQFTFDGVVVCSSDGTFGVSGRCTSGSNPWAAGVGTFLEVSQVTA